MLDILGAKKKNTTILFPSKIVGNMVLVACNALITEIIGFFKDVA
jgi:hypothetical protein